MAIDYDSGNVAVCEVLVCQLPIKDIKSNLVIFQTKQCSNVAEGIIVAKFVEKKKTLSKDVQIGGFVLCSNTSQDKIKELSFSHPRKILNITVTIFPRLSKARSCPELASIYCPKTINSRLKITGQKIEKILAKVVVVCILCCMQSRANESVIGT